MIEIIQMKNTPESSCSAHSLTYKGKGIKHFFLVKYANKCFQTTLKVIVCLPLWVMLSLLLALLLQVTSCSAKYDKIIILFVPFKESLSLLLPHPFHLMILQIIWDSPNILNFATRLRLLQQKPMIL